MLATLRRLPAPDAAQWRVPEDHADISAAVKIAGRQDPWLSGDETVGRWHPTRLEHL